MIIYEKNNKLNINFENSIEEQPDVVLGKEDGKTEVLVDGQPSGSGDSTFVVNILTFNPVTLECTADKTVQEVVEAAYNHQNIICVLDCRITNIGDTILYMSLNSVQISEDGFRIKFSMFDGTYFTSIYVTKDIMSNQYTWSYEEAPLKG